LGKAMVVRGAGAHTDREGASMTGYIQQLRAMVGHTPLILVGANVLILDDRGRLLLMHRADTGDWGLPGGFMEPGETVEEAARREVREETGLEVGRLALLGVFSGPEFYFEYSNGDQVFGVAVAYVADAFDGELRGDASESLELRFFALDELPDAMLPVDRPLVEHYLRAKGQLGT
jgi:ADP-ribose pyrophosphatase YjhB (NUDIX family)